MSGACPGCGVVNAGGSGTHPYMLASPGCWEAYGEVLAREFQDQALFAACHQLTVDAYALQHPGDPADRRARQSVWIHFAALDLVLDQGLPHAVARTALDRLARRDFPPVPPAPSWRVTVADVTAADHVATVRRWAKHAHAGWAPLLRPAMGGWLA